MGLNRKQQKRLFIVAFIAVLGLCVFLAAYFGETSPLIVEGKLEIASELEADAKGMRVVYIILHDEASAMPMPYGAFQGRIRQDAHGTFMNFTLTKENVQLMPAAMAGGEVKTFRVKARLDADGLGGADSAGDIVGEIKGVAPGSKNLLIKLNRRIGS